MADLTQPLSIGQAQQELQGRYSDYLRQKRELQGVRDTASQRFEGAFGPQGETGAVVNPADIFKSFKTFQSAVPSEAESLDTEANILNQIADLAKAQQSTVKQPSIAEQLAAEKAGKKITTDENGNLKLVPIDNTEEAYTKLNPNEVALMVKDTMGTEASKKVSDTIGFLRNAMPVMSNLKGAKKNAFTEMFSGSTGPLSTTFGDLFTPNTDKATLRTDIDTIKEGIRKDLYGSAFTDTERKIAILPGSEKTEATNRRRMNALISRKVEEVKSALVNAGLNEAQINDYFKNQNVDLTALETDQTSTQNMSVDVGQNIPDPLGLGI